MRNNQIHELLARIRTQPSYRPTGAEWALVLAHLQRHYRQRRPATPVYFTSKAQRVEIYRLRESAGLEIFHPSEHREIMPHDDHDSDHITNPAKEDDPEGSTRSKFVHSQEPSRILANVA